MSIPARCVILLTGLFALCPVGESSGLVLVDQGRSRHAIVLPSAAPETVRATADTLRAYLERISGARLPMLPAASRAAAPAVRIRVGAGSDPDTDVAALGPDGFRIRTEGADLVFTSATDDGFRHAVYTFLEQWLGCRRYSVEVQVVPRRPTIELPRIDETQVPPLTFRMQNLRDRAYTQWHKLDTNEGFGLFVHTFEELVPPWRYFDEHPEYFSLLNGNRTPQGQLCLTNPDVLRIVIEELRRRMAENPETDFWSVSQNDTYAPCECEACRAIDEAEGGHSGSILAFVNRVAAEFPDKTISTLAYQYSRSAPRTLRPLPNVNIMLCSIECDRSRPLTAHPGSASFVQDVHDWGALTNNIFLWDYVIQFRNLVSPFPNLRVLQPNLQFFTESGITAVFEQGLPVQRGEFAELRMYLISKLLWNPEADMEAILDDFLSGFYGEAAPWIRTYIDAMHDALEESGEELSIYGYPLASADGYLAPRRLAAYEEMWRQAEAAVAHRPEVLARVRTAHLPVQFARLEQAKVAGGGAGGCFDRHPDGGLRVRPGVRELLEVFVAGCRAAHIPRLWEHGISPDEYEAATRRFLSESVRPHLALGAQPLLNAPASPKYHDGLAAALTDGCRGWGDYRFHWLGFEGEDLGATIDLGEVVSVSSIETNCLQDIGSWVFLPLEVRFLISADGEEFRPVGTARSAVPATEPAIVVEPFAARFEPVSARFVRVEAVSRRTCPAWHKGSGGPAWIFLDEIAVR